MENRLGIAVQKSGRLSEKSLEMIRSCGIDFYQDSRVLKASSPSFPLDFLFVRDDDIPQYVYDGVADIGIVGRNELDESQIELFLFHGIKQADDGPVLVCFKADDVVGIIGEQPFALIIPLEALFGAL